MADMIARIEDDEGADAVFIDGGYGTGIVSVGRTLGRTWISSGSVERAADWLRISERRWLNSIKKYPKRAAV